MWDAIIITPFINVLLVIYYLVKSFGLAIILFTILIRLITHPLTAQQLKGTQAMQNLQKDPRWIDMQKKYKDDKEKLSQEQLKALQGSRSEPIQFVFTDPDPISNHHWFISKRNSNLGLISTGITRPSPTYIPISPRYLPGNYANSESFFMVELGPAG